MTLPAANTQWPPAPFDQVTDAAQVSQAWWEGDPHLLAEAATNGPRNRPSQYAGGIQGIAARTLWGKPQAHGETSRKLHIPIAADIVQMSSALLFADPPVFLIPTDAGDDEAKARLDRIMNTTQHHAALLVAAETCAAIGGVYPRIVWDADIVQNAWIDYVDADHAVPTFSWGRLVAVTFWADLPGGEDDRVWRHLQKYVPGKILHGLYVGDSGNLGRMMPLADHPATESIQVDADGAVLTGSDRLAAGYIPNARPNPAWRNDPVLRHLGRSDLSADVIPLMDQLDEIWSSLARDIRLGRARILVSEDMTRNLGAGKGSAFDTDQEIFTTVGPMADASGSMQSVIQSEQFAIRVTEHLESATAVVLEILRRTGYSPISFGMDEGGSASTATEIEARQRASTNTRTAKGRLWANTLSALGRTLLEVDAYLYGTGVVVTEDLDIDWPPVAKDTMLQTGRTLQALTAAEAASTKTKVQMLHPDWDDTRVDTEVEAIMNESGKMLPDFGPVSEADFAPPSAWLPETDTVEEGTKEPDE